MGASTFLLRPPQPTSDIWESSLRQPMQPSLAGFGRREVHRGCEAVSSQRREVEFRGFDGTRSKSQSNQRNSGSHGGIASVAPVRARARLQVFKRAERRWHTLDDHPVVSTPLLDLFELHLLLAVTGSPSVIRRVRCTHLSCARTCAAEARTLLRFGAVSTRISPA
ncbi:hypothetical protein K466DRAFT_349503 [Polyporus arcularius HHB13444]|uniref:Uncharacterized protein n=1 Tax=Polyporus arcularius HHB13444 TaxID=1314778 RepID=A0A5C3NUZ3_9APHY|nr:hypothetical protein K466DRAFT_349503 [Polyporus arcularius HHB13444]